MSELQERQFNSLAAGIDEPLIVVPVGDNEVRYFTSDEDAEAFVSDSSATAPIRLAGVWSDLDWEDAEAALDRIRHESSPTPPIENLL